MATKYFCDRCGKPINGDFGVKAVKIKFRREVGGQEWDEYRFYDLCADCIIQVKKFIREV